MIHTQLLRVLLTGTVLLATAVVASGCRGSRGEAAEGSVEAADDQGLQLSSCQLSMPGQALRVPAECGTLNVPEDRQHPEGRQLSLTVAVLRAVRRDPQPDPLFLLAGGPGQAATEAFLPLLGALRGIRQDRDLVLVDQRGTGSSHPLDCDMGQEGELDALDEEEQGERLQECLKTWDADPRFYHTAVAMEDLDAVRQALGYQRINLYGVSYGTRSALTYLRMFPERVRTILLDGVVPPDLVLGVEWGRDAQRALSLIFDRCRQDEACAEAFPELAGTFRDLLASLEKEPQEVTLPHPESGEETTLRTDRDLVAVLVQRLSYAPETVSLLPLLIHEAGREGRLGALVAQALTTSAAFGDLSTGMALSVICTEDEPFFEQQEVEEAAKGQYLGDYQARLLERLCASWPRGQAPAFTKEPLTSPVPALLLSGEADPVTPPEYGERVAAGFAHGLHLVAPGSGHNVLPRGCLPRLAEEFVESGSVEGLDASCVQEIEPMPFFLSPAGPAP